jgi:hypothetical protein
LNELKIKLASMEREKEEAYKKGGIEQAAKNNREMISSIIPRNLPQYRSDEDFEREVEHRANQLNEYTTIEDLKGLYDAKLWKYAKQLAGKTASMERTSFLDLIPNSISNIAGNSIIHRNSSNSIIHRNSSNSSSNRHEYDPSWKLSHS